MKKIVLFSLLVLIFPAAALADASESISDEMTTSYQELVTESTSISENITNESQAPASSETAILDEPTVESETAISEDPPSVDTSSTSEEMAAAVEVIAESTMSSSEDLEEQTAFSQAAVATRILSATPKTINPKEIAEKTKPVLTFEEDYIITEPKDVGQIRGVLTYSKFKIDPAELSGYTDQELENAFNLFGRYNDDITFMDWSGYVRVLQMLYRDNVISWSDVEKVLTFNSLDYRTTAELAKDIDQLQVYLRILYSNKEGFLQIRPFTNEELLQILSDLSGYEEELSEEKTFFSGILHWLYNSQEENRLEPVMPTLCLATSTNPAGANILSIPKSSSIPVSVQNNDATMNATTQKEYPKTGEKNTLPLSIIGVACFFISGFILLEKRFRV